MGAAASRGRAAEAYPGAGLQFEEQERVTDYSPDKDRFAAARRAEPLWVPDALAEQRLRRIGGGRSSIGERQGGRSWPSLAQGQRATRVRPPTEAEAGEFAQISLPMATAVSAMRFEKPHSLSYQDRTRQKVPSITLVWSMWNTEEWLSWLKSEETSFSSV